MNMEICTLIRVLKDYNIFDKMYKKAYNKFNIFAKNLSKIQKLSWPMFCLGIHLIPKAWSEHGVEAL